MEALLFALRRAANELHDTLTCGSGFHARLPCVVVAKGFLLLIDDAPAYEWARFLPSSCSCRKTRAQQSLFSAWLRYWRVARRVSYALTGKRSLKQRLASPHSGHCAQEDAVCASRGRRAYAGSRLTSSSGGCFFQ